MLMTNYARPTQFAYNIRENLSKKCKLDRNIKEREDPRSGMMHLYLQIAIRGNSHIQNQKLVKMGRN